MVDYTKFLSSLAREMRASEIRELLKVVQERNIISLAGGLPDPNLFPREELAEIARNVIIEQGAKALQYSPTKGVPVFLEALSRFLQRHNVAVKKGDDLIATVGSQQALYLIAKVFINPGDYIVVEAPSYLGALNAFRQYGARFLSVPIDENGMLTDKLEEVLKRAKAENLPIKMIYTMPTCHNPAGTTMPDERRRHLLELAEQYDLLVVEDDPYSFITFGEMVFTHLKTMDTSGRVLYLGTVSKIMAPGLRLGWILGPKELVSKIELAKQAIDLHTPTLNQYIAAKALDSGVIERRFNLLRQVYREKRDAMLEALEEHMPEDAKWTKPIGGLFVFVWLPEGMDSRKLLEIAIEKGVAFVPGDAFYADRSGKNTMRLNFSYPSKDEIREGIRRIGEAIRELTGKR